MSIHIRVKSVIPSTISENVSIIYLFLQQQKSLLRIEYFRISIENILKDRGTMFWNSNTVTITPYLARKNGQRLMQMAIYSLPPHIIKVKSALSGIIW